MLAESAILPVRTKFAQKNGGPIQRTKSGLQLMRTSLQKKLPLFTIKLPEILVKNHCVFLTHSQD